MKSVDVSNFGEVACCNNLLGFGPGYEPTIIGWAEYFEPMVRGLETDAGYERGKNIFGAPYDWRYGGGESRMRCYISLESESFLTGCC